MCGRPNALRRVHTSFNAKLVLTNFLERIRELPHQLVGRSNIYVCSRCFKTHVGMTMSSASIMTRTVLYGVSLTLATRTMVRSDSISALESVLP